MNIWYFCFDPKISLHNTQYAPSIHITETMGGLQSLGHQVRPFLYADNLRQTERGIRQNPLKLGQLNFLLGRAKPLLRDMYELYQNIFQDKSLIEPIFRNNSIDLVYERMWQSKSVVSACACQYKAPLIVESNTPVEARKQEWGSPLSFFIKRLEKKILQRADAVTVVSTPLKRYYEKLGVPSQKITVLPNAINEQRFSPGNMVHNVRAELGLDGKIVVGFVANIRTYHGIELLLQLARALQSARNEIHFLIVGSGLGRDELETALAQENLDSLFTFVGSVPNSEVPAYIAGMDICFLPRSNWYGSPMKILEYGAMAKPIIAPDIETVRDMVQHGVTAFLFEPENIPAMAQAIQELAGNAQLRAQLGDSARRHILANHTWTKNAERIMEIYQQIVL